MEAMETEDRLRLADVFVGIADPRQAGKVAHDLVKTLVVAVNAVLAGVDSFVEIELWAREKLEWLRGYLRLARGIPSHDTFGRLFGLIDPDEFETAFRRWVSSLLPAPGAEVVAVDGKTSRRSGGIDATALHLVSAFAAGAGLVLGQKATAEKSSEKVAIPELLSTLALTGCTVTIDAMGTQANIARMIRDRGADYVLAVKDNQPKTGRVDPGFHGGFSRRRSPPHAARLRADGGKRSRAGGDAPLLRLRSDRRPRPAGTVAGLEMLCGDRAGTLDPGQNHGGTAALYQQPGSGCRPHRRRRAGTLAGREPLALVHGCRLQR